MGRDPELELKGPWFESPCNQLFFPRKKKYIVQCARQILKKEEKEKVVGKGERRKKERRTIPPGYDDLALAKALIVQLVMKYEIWYTILL